MTKSPIQLKVGLLDSLVFCLAVLCTSASAQSSQSIDKEQQNCQNNSIECVEIGKWNFSVLLGIGIRTNPVIQGSDIPLILLPSFSYYGENFFIENLDLGYTLLDTGKSSLNIVATPSYDSVFFNRWDPSNFFVDLSSVSASQLPLMGGNEEDRFTEINIDEISSRKFSYLGGLEFSQQFANAQLSLSFLTDLTNTHSGSEARAAFDYQFDSKVKLALGLTWKDRKLTDYYYALKPNEIVDDRGVYRPSASLSPFVRLSYISREQEHENWRFSVEYQTLSKQIRNSPLVNENNVITVFIGKNFSF